MATGINLCLGRVLLAPEKICILKITNNCQQRRSFTLVIEDLKLNLQKNQAKIKNLLTTDTESAANSPQNQVNLPPEVKRLLPVLY